MADDRDGLTDGGILVGRNDEDLRGIRGSIRNEDERRMPVTLNVELDPAEAFEWHCERQTIVDGNGNSAVGHEHVGVGCLGVDAQLLAGLEQTGYLQVIRLAFAG